MRLRNAKEEEPLNWQKCIVWKYEPNEEIIVLIYDKRADIFFDIDMSESRYEFSYWVPLSEIIEELTK